MDVVGNWWWLRSQMLANKEKLSELSSYYFVQAQTLVARASSDTKAPCANYHSPVKLILFCPTFFEVL